MRGGMEEHGFDGMNLNDWIILEARRIVCLSKLFVSLFPQLLLVSGAFAGGF